MALPPLTMELRNSGLPQSDRRFKKGGKLTSKKEIIDWYRFKKMTWSRKIERTSVSAGQDVCLVGWRCGVRAVAVWFMFT